MILIEKLFLNIAIDNNLLNSAIYRDFKIINIILQICYDYQIETFILLSSKI